MQKQLQQRPVLKAYQFDDSVPPWLQKIYASRGVLSSAALDLSLQALPRPDALKGVDEAVRLLAEVVEKQQKLVIVGDFDCDGATSTALLILVLSAMGLDNVGFVVPDRFVYGYGLSPEIVTVAAQQQPDVLITVDNGIASIDGVASARALGIKVIVTDHHLPGPELPAADAIVNPNQPACSFPSKNLAGVGVAFYVLLQLRQELRQRGWFERQNIAEPNMADFLDLLALGTVADVVSLDHLNRVLVQQGLLRIRSGKTRPGIKALLELAGRQMHSVGAQDLGFALGPRINAAGRLDDMSLGIMCLIAPEFDLAMELARELDNFNRDRRQIEAGMQREAEALLAQLDMDQENLPYIICLYHPDWHQGVIGILASRIKERYHRPVIAFARTDKANELKGSARSIKGVHMRDLLDAVATLHPGLLTKFGGHAMAAGMSLALDQLQAFSNAVDQFAAKTISPSVWQAVIETDGMLADEQFQLATAEQIQAAGPWGQAFPEPCFEGEFILLNHRILAEKHVKLTLALPASRQIILDAIAFNTDISVWQGELPSQVYLAFKLDVNEYRGQRNLQLLIDYIQPW